MWRIAAAGGSDGNLTANGVRIGDMLYRAAYLATLAFKADDCVLLQNLDSFVSVETLVEVSNLGCEEPLHESVLREDDGGVNAIQIHAAGTLQPNIASSYYHSL